MIQPLSFVCYQYPLHRKVSDPYTCKECIARLLAQIQPAEVHSTAIICLYRASCHTQNRLSQPLRFSSQDCPDLCNAIGLKSVPHFTTLHKASQRLLCNKVADKLLLAPSNNLPKTKNTIDLAAIDSTGLDSNYVSRYFVRRRRSKHLNLWEDTIYSRFPKLAIVCDCSNHAILSAMTTRGPSVDVNQFCKPLKPAAERVKNRTHARRCRLRQ